MTLRRHAALVSAVALAIAGCGSTQIVTNDRSAQIYVDGEPVGRGEAEITKRGAPDSITVEVRGSDGRRVQTCIARW